MKCPKCGYERQPTDTAPAWQCPACKVAYVKAQQAAKAPAAAPVAPPPHSQPEAAEIDEEQALYEQEERLFLAAGGQKIVIYSIIANFVLRSAEKSQAIPEPGLSVLFFCVSLFSVLGVLKICSGLERSQNKKILCMVLSFFPFINIVMLIYLSAKTNKLLKAAGWKIGLLGAKP